MPRSSKYPAERPFLPPLVLLLLISRMNPEMRSSIVRIIIFQMLLGVDYPNQIRSSFFTETVKKVILFDTHDMIIADFCFSRILQVQTLCVCVCQPKNCRKILEFWLIVNLETKKVPLLALGLSRRPGSASQLRLAPPTKRLTMEEEEKNSDEYGTGARQWERCLCRL